MSIEIQHFVFPRFFLVSFSQIDRTTTVDERRIL